MIRARRTAATGAFVILLAACGGGSISSTTEALLPIATTPALTDAPATTVADEDDSGLSEAQRAVVAQLIAAHEAGDAPAVLALWADEDNHYRWGIEFDISMGGRWSDVDCAATSSGEPRCELFYTNDLLTALEAPPLAGYFRLELAPDGLITAWDYDSGNRSTTATYLLPFSDWVRETDPVAADRMFDWNGFGFQNVESYELWTVKAAEYLATLG